VGKFVLGKEQQLDREGEMNVEILQQAGQYPFCQGPQEVRQLHRFDWGILLLLVLVTVGYVGWVLRLSSPPAEDAAILMRYAVHLAEGHGIVWNVGEKPVDGATDFLFMLMVAGLVSVGLPAELAVRSLTFVAHVANVVLVYVALRSLWGAPWWVAVVPSFFLAVASGAAYISLCFGAPVFALCASVSWFFALRAAVWGNTFPNTLAFGAFSLVTGLVRPEGVILTFLMLLAVLVLRGWRETLPIAVAWVVFVIGLGGTYFLWRWHYFGYPLPNPFYKKAGGVLHLDELRHSYAVLGAMGLPFWVLSVGGLLFREVRRLLIGILIPPIGFATAFILISNEMNIAGRYQYPALPLLLIGVYPAAWAFYRWLQPQPRREMFGSVGLYLLCAVLFLLLVYSRALLYRSWWFHPDGRVEVAKRLAEFRLKGYWMAVSEAGALPFYSGWNAVDTWGLNDPWIVRHGVVTQEYLDRYRPHVIMFHAYFSPVAPANSERRASRDPRILRWEQMLDTLMQYAERRGYILAAVYGETPYDTHYYYVRPDFPDAAAIVQRIRSTRYIWYQTGRPCINYALLEPKASPKEP
jgi:arabinofuranosyltransferase